MSIRDLFEKNESLKILASTNIHDIREDAESDRNIDERFSDVERFIPQVDYSNPENFARFGSAEKYYNDSIERIYRQFPYDGTEADINDFYNKSTYIDKYVLSNLYPRTTGYITFSPHDSSDHNGGWGAGDTSPIAANLYYGEPTGKEYIEVRGGPHSASAGMPSGSLAQSFTGSNYYDTNIYTTSRSSSLGVDGTRESNLRMNLDDGITVEFWLKKESFIASKTQKEVIFDLWNQVTSSSPQYGRLRLELTASGYAEDGANPFRFTFLSGGVVQDTPDGSGFEAMPLGGTTVTTASVADNKWHHYAFSVVNERAVANKTIVRFYRDGELVSTTATGSVAGEVTGSLMGFIGALQTAPSRSAKPADSMVGWGKLSGSIDEFRYWKARRNHKQIKKNWLHQVKGGTNTDVANAELGVYYKFNEGVVGDSSIDSAILDYSGRISNGIWVGYASGARSTGSAIVESSGSNLYEFKDPIIYEIHPDVQSLKSNLKVSASYHDTRNNSSLYYSMPSWMIDEDREENDQLMNLTQIMGSYLDTIYLQIEALTDLKAVNYQTSSGKPLPFANHLLESYGLTAPEIFSNATVLESIMNRDEDREFSQDIYDIKNLIYQNVYNNLVYIYKTKGTEKSFRNLIRCFGVDDELIKINLYGDNVTHLLRDNFKPRSVKKNYVNFFHADNHDAVVTHWISSPGATSADNPDAVGVTYISASHKDFASTAEAEVIFPRIKEVGEPNYYEITFTDSSLFGWDQADPDPDDYIKPTNGSGYQVLAVRPERSSKDARFHLIDRSNDVTIATSSLYKGVYDNQRWTFALRTRNVMTSSITPTDPATSHGIGTYLTGGPGDDGANTHVEVSLYGVHTAYDRIQEEFSLSGNAIHSDITVPRRYYVGARRTNVTGGTINEYSSAKVGYLRHWESYLKNNTIQAHARDTENYGVRNPYKSAYLLETPLTGVWMPEYETLALNWDFSNVTGSDPSGEFLVKDFSSGSLSLRRFRDTDMSSIVGNQYNARGYFFKTSTTAAVDTNYIASARYQLPEVLNSHDMVEIRNQDDLVFTRETRPVKHFFAFEKSMYQTISEEMLNMFAGIVEFNNLIGEGVNKYRGEYKDMAKLRQLFYERIENTPNLDKYISYYKWLDTALGVMLQQLVPGSSAFSKNIRNMVEDTILTRSKYRHKFPNIESRRQTEIEGQIKGIYELTYNWRKGHAPMYSSDTKTVHPQPQGKNCLWWLHRAERHGASATSDKASIDHASSLVAVIDEQRNNFKRVGFSFVSASVPEFTALQGTPGISKFGINNIPIYAGSYYPNNRFSRPYRLFVATGFNSKAILGAWNSSLGPGSNPVIGPSSKYTYWRHATSFTETTTFIEITNLKEIGACDKNPHPVHPPDGVFPVREKGPIIIAEAVDGKGNTFKSSMVTPFSLYKNSVSTGYKSVLSGITVSKRDGTSAAGGIELNNLHQDVVETGEVSMQGPFAEKYVGGLPHRHVDLNTSKAGSLDSLSSRPEGWKFTISSTGVKILHQDSDKPRGDYYRNVKAKRPVNIRNIQALTGTAKLNKIGNFANHYELVQTSDRSINNRAFVKNEGFGGMLPSNTDASLITDIMDYKKADFSIAKSPLGATKHVIVERFSAPGGPETAADANGGHGIDAYSGQYSPYNNLNYRNLSVRLPLRTLLANHANQFGFAFDSFAGTRTSTVSKHDYSGIPAFHKTNRNSALRHELSGSRTTSETTTRAPVHDNYYVTHEIPQSDTQYWWITGALANNFPEHRTVVLGHPHPDGTYSSSVSLTYRDGVTVGPGYIPAYNFVSASDYVTKARTNNVRYWGSPETFDKRANDATYSKGLYTTDFIGLNGNIVQIFDTDTLTLSGNAQSGQTNKVIFQYVNTVNGSDTGEFISSPVGGGAYEGQSAAVLNSLSLNRNGPYGYPTWKQIRVGETRIGRYLGDNNYITYTPSPGLHRVKETKGSRIDMIDRFGATRVHKEPPVVSDYFPLKFVLGITTATTAISRPIRMKSTYGNYRSGFSDPSLNRARGFIKPPPLSYETITGLYLDGGLEDPSSPVNSFINLCYKETIYPKEVNTYLRKVRQRDGYANNFWRLSQKDRAVLGKSKLSFNEIKAANTTFGSGQKRSSWNLDAIADAAFLGDGGVSGSITGSDSGMLQDYSAYVHSGLKAGLTASVCYARPHMLSATASLRSWTGPEVKETGSTSLAKSGAPLGRIQLFGGLTRWEAGEQAGKINDLGTFVSRSTTPAYDSYEEYSDDLRSIAQEYSVVPEFRISDHMEFYMNKRNGNFLVDNPKFLSIFGASSASLPQNSSQDKFYKIFTNSDFMKYFASIKRDHKELMNPTELTLTCKAAMKFLPYDGFYPSERTAQIATQFSKSYANHISYQGADASVGTSMRLRPILAPFFSPGIMFNTIKAGVACDWPIYTGSYKVHNPWNGDNSKKTDYFLIATASDPTLDSKGKLAGWDYRVPFEALAEPEKYIKNITFVDMEPHPSAAINVTCSWGGSGDQLYKMMSQNFLAEVPEFFLPKGEFSTLTSVPESQILPFDTGSVYGMRIKIRKSYHQERQPEALGTIGYFVPQDTIRDRSRLQESFTMYSRPSAFGPPVSGRNGIGHAHSSKQYDHLKIADSLQGINPSFTPPYYHGEAWCDIIVRPSSSYVSLDDILADSQKIYWRFDNRRLPAPANNTHPYGDLNINRFSMQLSSSFNLFQKASGKIIQYDILGNPMSVQDDETGNTTTWVMQPKFETPMYNFSDSGVHPISDGHKTLTIPTNCSESVAKGMWHQFGVTPTDPQKGIFLEVSDIPQSWQTKRVPMFNSGSHGSAHSIDVNQGSWDNSEYASIYNSGGSIESLLDKVNFPKRSVKLGQTAKKKIVREGVVAIPFMINKGKRKFFNLDKEMVKGILGMPNVSKMVPGDSVRQQIESMKKYVMPPVLDFVTFTEEVQPIVMHIFDFEYEFSQDDLSHMWQNLQPPSGKIVKKSEVKVTQKLLINEMFGEMGECAGSPLEDRLRWMVFKVKQRANADYFSKVAGYDQQTDPRFKFGIKVGRAMTGDQKIAEYSYNWPYDFFSLIELAKIDAELCFGPYDDSTPEELKYDTDRGKIEKGITPHDTDRPPRPDTPSPVPPSATAGTTAVGTTSQPTTTTTTTTTTTKVTQSQPVADASKSFNNALPERK
jgi:hypothetical protein